MECKKFSKEYWKIFREIYKKHLVNLENELKDIGFEEYLSVTYKLYGADDRIMSSGTRVIIDPLHLNKDTNP